MLKILKRPPDVIIGAPDQPYMLRWWIIPRNRFFNIYLHKFLQDDDDRALHDHPWWSCSIILRGGYIEHLKSGIKHRKAGRAYFRTAETAHRIELYKRFYPCCGGKGTPIKTWSLFITGRKTRDWGFHCPQGFRRWQDFVDQRNHGEVGRGCE